MFGEQCDGERIALADESTRLAELAEEIVDITIANMRRIVPV